MTPQLLIDTQPLVLQLSESDDGKSIKFKGIFGSVEYPTANGRLYGPKLMEREIKRLMKPIGDDGKLKVLGELDHPQDGRTKLQRVSHVIKDLSVQFPNIIGEAFPLDTPNGRILKALAKAGVSVGVSSRGFGSTKARGDGVEEVQEDYRLDTYDFVYQPASDGAYPTFYAEEKQLVQALEDGTMDLTLDVLRKDYPELVEMIVAEAKDQALTEAITEEDRDRAVQTAVTEAVTETETRTERRVKERLTSGLLSEMESVQEAALEQARSEAASDPHVSGAIGLCEQIAAIIQPFGVAPDTKAIIDKKDEEIAVLEAKVAERELEVQKIQREAKENAELAKEAAFSLHLERKLRTEEETRRDAIVNLVGPTSAFESKDALDSRVKTVMAELDSAKPDTVEENERSEFEQRLATLEQGMTAAKERAEKAESLVREANERTRKALDAAEEMAAQGYAEGIATSHHEGDKLRALAEEVTSIAAVDKIVTSLGKPPVVVPPAVAQADETVMEAIRRRTAAGKERDLEEEHTGRGSSQQNKGKSPSNGSNGKGLFEELDLSEGEFDRLAGNPPRQ